MVLPARLSASHTESVGAVSDMAADTISSLYRPSFEPAFGDLSGRITRHLYFSGGEMHLPRFTAVHNSLPL